MPQSGTHKLKNKNKRRINVARASSCIHEVELRGRGEKKIETKLAQKNAETSVHGEMERERVCDRRKNVGEVKTITYWQNGKQTKSTRKYAGSA